MESPMPETMGSVDQVTKGRSGPFRITAIFREFSNEIIHQPGNLHPSFRHIDYPEVDESFAKNNYSSRLYANGWNEDSAGYVCIRLRAPSNVKIFEGICLVSVIDGNGDPRFSRSLTFSVSGSQQNRQGVIYEDKYIARETLLSDPDDLLPNDTLTLQTEIYVVNCTGRYPSFYGDMLYSILQCFQAEDEILPVGIRGIKCECRVLYLLLDNDFAKLLSQESEYFERILDTPMVEKKNRRTRISFEEFLPFQHIAKILLGMTPLGYGSVREILNMCIIADKYDIPSIMQTCLCFLKCILSDHDADEILKLSASYPFRESMYDLSYVIQRAIDDAQETKDVSQETGDSEWVYGRDDDDDTVMYFENRKRRVLQVDEEKRMTRYEEESEFDFYK